MGAEARAPSVCRGSEEQSGGGRWWAGRQSGGMAGPGAVTAAHRRGPRRMEKVRNFGA